MGAEMSNVAAGNIKRPSPKKWVLTVLSKLMSIMKQSVQNIKQRLGLIKKPENGNDSELKIVMAPNKGLKLPGTVVQEPLDINLITEMGQLMCLSEGAGLAANQVGINETFFVASLDAEFTVCINPVILRHGKEEIETPEGCLSVRDHRGKIIYKPKKRWAIIDVSYYTLEGFIKAAPTFRTFRRFDAKLFQHEMDHMKGVLCQSSERSLS